LAELGPLQSIRITHPQAKFVEFLGERGAEIDWDWERCRPDAAAMVADLINKELLLEREYVTHAAQLRGTLKLRLTDKGRAVLEQLQVAQKKVTIIPAPPS
jgi:hypothetical protein